MMFSLNVFNTSLPAVLSSGQLINCARQLEKADVSKHTSKRYLCCKALQTVYKLTSASGLVAAVLHVSIKTKR